MRSGWWGMGLLLAGCGASPPSTLDDLPNKRISLLASFNAPAPQSPALSALLKFDDVRYCPPFELAVDLDGVMLDSAPAATGSDGETCQLGFYLTASPPAAAPQSTLRFTHLVNALIRPRPRQQIVRRGGGQAHGVVVCQGMTSDDMTRANTLPRAVFSTGAVVTDG